MNPVKRTNNYPPLDYKAEDFSTFSTEELQNFFSSFYEEGYTLFIEFTPSLAKRILAIFNTKNRPISRDRCRNYKETMLQGNWKAFNGDTISISTNGRLLNGQHRLTALSQIEDENFSLPFLVVFGVEDHAFDTIDVGKFRTSGDILSIAGVSNARSVGAALNLIDSLLKKRLVAPEVKVYGANVLELLEKYPGVPEIVSDLNKDRFIRIRPRVIHASAWMLSRTHPDRAFAFFEFLATGKGTDVFENIWQLREKFIRFGDRLTLIESIGMVFKTWNYCILGKKLTGLQFSKESPFPIPIGWEKQLKPYPSVVWRHRLKVPEEALDE